MPMYNVLFKDYQDGTCQLCFYSFPILTGSNVLDNIDMNHIVDLFRSDDVNLHSYAKRILDEQNFIKDNKPIIRCCELTDEEYQEFLNKLDKQHLHSQLCHDVRDKKKVYDLARANTWEYFLTFTFSPEKVNRYDFVECKNKLKKWLNNISQRYCGGNLKYLIVPETHKDGAWHFHGLLANTDGITFLDSGIGQNGMTVYNLPQYRLGFSTATKVKDTKRVSRYITKYMTKSLSVRLRGQHRHFASRNLTKPIVRKLALTDYELSELLSNYFITWTSSKDYSVGDFSNTINIFELEKENFT